MPTQSSPSLNLPSSQKTKTKINSYEAYLVHIGVLVLVIMNRKLYAVVDLRTALGAEIWVEAHIRRECNGGAVKGLFVQNDETFNVVHRIWH